MSDDNLLVPLIGVGRQEEAQDLDPESQFGAAVPKSELPEAKNYANDEKCIRFFQDDIYRTMDWTRSNRTNLEEEWNAIRRMTMLHHDSGQKYKGRSNAYLPVYSRILTTLVSSLSTGLFPSDEYMDVSVREGGDPRRADPVKAYLQWEFDHVCRLRAQLKPFLRQYCNYGNSVLKYWYKTQTQKVGRGKRVPSVFDPAGQSIPTFRKVRTYDGLAVSTRSLMYWYIYPLTAVGLEDATLVFEDVDTPRSFIQDMARKGKWLNKEEALNAPEVSNHSANRSTLLSEAGEAGQSDLDLGTSEVGGVRTITEIWTYMPLPSSAYTDDEEVGSPLPVCIHAAGITPLSITRNPFWHQRPPYLFTAQNQEPGFVYGNGFGRVCRGLQYLVNDFANQTNDCGIYGLNPIVKVNPGLLAGPLPPIRPGVVWNMTDVNAGVQFDRPPVEQTQYGMQLLSQYIGMAQDFGGAPPVLQGSGAGKGARTATGAQILQFNAQQPLADVVEDIEMDVMIPLMFGTWINAQQYRDRAVMTRVAGVDIKVSPQDLDIDPEFRWLASSQAANAQQRNQQAMSLLQGIIPVYPLLQQAGYSVDPAALIKRVFSGMGFRGFDEFIKKNPMAAMGPMGIDPNGPSAPQSGAPGPVPPSDRVRSTVEQAGGATDQIAPGEGEDFMSMRAEADLLAGGFGG